MRRRGRSSMVEPQPSKLVMRVRSPPPALGQPVGEGLDRRCGRLEVARLEAGDELAGERERLALLARERARCSRPQDAARRRTARRRRSPARGSGCRSPPAPRSARALRARPEGSPSARRACREGSRRHLTRSRMALNVRRVRDADRRDPGTSRPPSGPDGPVRARDRDRRRARARGDLDRAARPRVGRDLGLPRARAQPGRGLVPAARDLAPRVCGCADVRADDRVPRRDRLHVRPDARRPVQPVRPHKLPDYAHDLTHGRGGSASSRRSTTSRNGSSTRSGTAGRRRCSAFRASRSPSPRA